MDTTPLSHDAWCAWHPQELARRLSGIERPWCVVGGWALDLWHGVETRVHDDLEFTILRADFDHFRAALPGMRFHAVGDGQVEALGEREIPPGEIAQVWCEDIAARCWRVDMMLEDGTPKTWVYKRDPAVRRPRGEMVRMTAEGIPYLVPEAILLFKAKYRRDKDEADFTQALPKLDARQRHWLKARIAETHPGHGWLRDL
nr:amino acid transporter [uncultured Shinella sp.]